MKKSITLFAMATLITSLAMASDTGKNYPKAPHNSFAANLATYDKVARENEALRAQLLKLTDETAELKSQLAYQSMMSNLFLSLRNADYEKAIADFQATQSYNHMMANMFSRLNQLEKIDQQEDARAMAAYENMMKNMFEQLKSAPIH